MTHDRPYRRAMPIALAVNELWRESGGQFDRALVPLFVMELERDRDGLGRAATVGVAAHRLDRSRMPDPGVERDTRVRP